MRVLVCGGRDCTNPVFVNQSLFDLADKHHWWEARDHGVLVFITGGARGADLLAAEWAATYEIRQEIYPALWNIFGSSAGPLRNQQMLDTGIDVVIAFTGGRGTDDMVRRAKKAGVEVIEVKYD